jgi:hypothetical protein
MGSIWKTLEEAAESSKNWIIAHQSNPLLWIGLFLGGLLIFSLVYNALQKEK